MAESWLDKYRNEIVSLRQDSRYTQAEIKRHLEDTYNISVPKTTLSNYLRSLPEAQQPLAPGEIRVSPEEERFFEQREVFEFLKQANERLIEAMAQLLARMGTLEDTGQNRQDTLLATLQRAQEASQAQQSAILAGLRHGGENASPDSLHVAMQVVLDELKKQGRDLDALRQRLGIQGQRDSQEAGSVRRRRDPALWLRALLVTGGFWAVLLVLGVALYLAPWR